MFARLFVSVTPCQDKDITVNATDTDGGKTQYWFCYVADSLQ